ncbi:MAG: helix-turn-helix domain-containing protein [Deltaproteobacteria bacterium]|nr:helix-turn-helix domain-containing protein [Deltaproteobacteria bacterium]
MERCFSCGAKTLGASTLQHQIRLGGSVFRVTLDALECASCGESSVDGPLLARAELEVAARLAASGFASGQAFRFMRKALGLRAADVAALLAVRAETVSRWETGRTAVDRGAFAALAAMVTDQLGARTTTRDVLRALQRPVRAPRRISLDLSQRREG